MYVESMFFDKRVKQVCLNMYPINVSVFYRNNDNVFKLQKYIFDRVSLC